MVFIVKVINGVKKIIPVTADAGAGNPVGSYLYLEKKSNPQGYLYCDGSTFDETKYPLLYAYLGSNVLPDWREFSAVGAEQNTTSSNIATHDVYTQGEEKDDQFQDHGHKKYWIDSAGISINNDYPGTYNFQDQYNSVIENGASGRAGTVTRGKRKAVFIYIKATSGLSENAQDNVINTLNEQRSYSTEEHLTGKKWIDGKPIYRKVIDCGMLPNATSKSTATGLTNIGTIISIKGIANTTDANTCVPIPYVSINANDTSLNIACYYANGNIILKTFIDMTVYTKSYVTLEYTKTT